jgi:hypothetical protein
MALIIKDRVKEITTTTGTGDVSLGGASATFDAFQSVMSNGDTTFYAIVHTASGTDEWEVGVGTWNTGNTLTRTTVYAGSNGTSAVNFSSGNKDIFMTYPASKAAVAGEDVTFADITATDITATGTVTLSGDPTSALQAATKEYVDTIAAAGIHYHTPVRVEAPSALTATYDNGTSGVGATLTNSGTQAALVIDGVTLSTSDRVLVYNQTNAAHNGVYTVTDTGSASTNWVLTRATDADSYGASDPDALGEGDAYFVKEGDTGAGELYVMNTAGTITFGTTDITFTVIAETAVYSAGDSLTLTGTTFDTVQDIRTTASPTFNNITVTGTVDGRDVATDGSKLDGIEAGATADQTAAEIKTAYESNSDTNAFTDAEQTKLSGIETGATGDQTASEILTAIKTVDGAASGLDADLLDGQQGSYYLNTGTTFSGDVSGTYNNIVVANDSHTHDGRYYTETEADSRFVNVTGDTISGVLAFSQNPVGTTYGGTSSSTPSVMISQTVGDNDGWRLYGEAPSTNDVKMIFEVVDDLETGDTWIFRNKKTYSPYSSTDDFKITGAGEIYARGNGYVNSNQRIFADNYHPNADKWTTARTLSLSGDASGSVSWDGSANATLSVTVADDSHNHTISNIDNLSVGSLTGMRLSTTSGYIEFGPANTSWAHIYTDRPNFYFNKDLYVIGARVYHTNYHPEADAWTTARTLSLSGDASGSVSWDGSANATLSVTVANDSHSHSNYLTSNAADSLVPSGWTAPSTHAALNIGYNGSGQTRAIDIDGSWSTNESKAISFTHGSSSSNLVGQWDVQHNGPGSRMRWGKLYHSGDSSTYTMELVSTSTTTADLYVNSGKVWHQNNDGSGSGLDADLLDGYHLSTTRNAANTVPVRDGNGYLQLGWINTTSGATTSIDKIYASADNYIRYVTPATFRSQVTDGYYLGASSKAADSNLLDGIDSSSFLRSDAADTASGALSFTSTLAVGGGNGIGDGKMAVRGGDLLLDRGYELRWNTGTGSGEYIYSKTSSPYDVTIHSGSYDALQAPNTGELRINYQGAQKLITNSSGVSITGTGSASSDFRAPIFYDSNDTAYYTDPASESSLYSAVVADRIKFGNSTYGTGAQIAWNNISNNMRISRVTGISFDWGTGSGNSDGYTYHGISSVDHNNNAAGDMRISSRGNIIFRLDTDANSTNNYLRFFNNYVSGTTTEMGQWGGGTGTGNLFVYGNIYTGLYYDRFDTGYYVDPNGSSQMHTLFLQGPVYSRGDSNTRHEFHAADEWRVVVGGSERLEVKNSSPHVLVTGDLNSTSDERLKENVAPITNALADVTQLEGVSFDWKDTGTRGHGFIAQQVEPILPDVVNTDEETGIKSINYVGMIGHLVEAIKELKAEIDELKK